MQTQRDATRICCFICLPWKGILMETKCRPSVGTTSLRGLRGHSEATKARSRRNEWRAFFRPEARHSFRDVNRGRGGEGEGTLRNWRRSNFGPCFRGEGSGERGEKGFDGGSLVRIPSNNNPDRGEQQHAEAQLIEPREEAEVGRRRMARQQVAWNERPRKLLPQYKWAECFPSLSRATFSGRRRNTQSN